MLPVIRLSPKNARNVKPVPIIISFFGLKRGTTTGPTQRVNKAASGNPRVMSCSGQLKAFL